MSLVKMYEQDFRRFDFPGFGQVGTCFLRARVNPDGSSIFLCVQLIDYTSTSVTNAVEDIFMRAVRTLQEAGAYKFERPRWYSFKRELSFADIVARCRWVEHYPKGTGMFSEGSYALVSFDSEFRPVWNYVTLERAARECGVDQDFFKIPRDDLQYAP